MRVQWNVEDSIKSKPHLERYATRLRQLDKNNDGELDVEEVCNAIDEMVETEKQNKLLKKLAMLFGVISLFTIAAVVGLTYAVVVLSQDTQDSNNVLVSKNSGDAMATAQYLQQNSLDAWLSASPTELSSLQTIIVPGTTGDLDYTVYTVSATSKKSDGSLQFKLGTGDVAQYIPGLGLIMEEKTAAGTGRRRLMGGGSTGKTTQPTGTSNTNNAATYQSVYINVYLSNDDITSAYMCRYSALNTSLYYCQRGKVFQEAPKQAVANPGGYDSYYIAGSVATVEAISQPNNITTFTTAGTTTGFESAVDIAIVTGIPDTRAFFSNGDSKSVKVCVVSGGSYTNCRDLAATNANVGFRGIAATYAADNTKYNVYLAEPTGNSVSMHEYDPAAGTLTWKSTLSPPATNGPSNQQFSSPYDVSILNGKLYIANYGPTTGSGFVSACSPLPLSNSTTCVKQTSIAIARPINIAVMATGTSVYIQGLTSGGAHALAVCTSSSTSPYLSNCIDTNLAGQSIGGTPGGVAVSVPPSTASTI